MIGDRLTKGVGLKSNLAVVLYAVFIKSSSDVPLNYDEIMLLPRFGSFEHCRIMRTLQVVVVVVIGYTDHNFPQPQKFLPILIVDPTRNPQIPALIATCIPLISTIRQV
jgi:hypothetical protein